MNLLGDQPRAALLPGAVKFFLDLGRGVCAVGPGVGSGPLGGQEVVDTVEIDL